MGICEIVAPYLFQPLTAVGIGILMVALRFVYRFSSYSFIPSAISWTAVSGTLQRAAGYVFLAYQKRITVLLAAVTTYSSSIKVAAQVFQGGGSLMDLLLVVVRESGQKFLAAPVRVAEGFTKLAEVVQTESVCAVISTPDPLVQGFYLVWVGVAGFILALNLYRFAIGAGMNQEIAWYELLMVVAILVLSSAVVHSVTDIVQGVKGGLSLLDGVAQGIGGEVNSTAVNQTKNMSSG